MTAWTPDLMARAEAMIADGVTFEAVGRDLGFSKNAVIGKARRKGWMNRDDAVLNIQQIGQKKARETKQMESGPTTLLTRLSALDIFPGFARCVFPLGGRLAPARAFCGDAVLREGAPYCAAHAALCWQAAPKKPERAA